MTSKWLSLLALAMISTSCSLMRRTPKSEFKDGFYTQKTNETKRRVYIDLEADSLIIYPAKKTDGKKLLEPNGDKEQFNPGSASTSFSSNTLDIDFLIMPLKYRPSTKGVPVQLNTTLNGSVFLGYRTDRFSIGYETDPLNRPERDIDHYGFSFGVFCGLGNAYINPTNTDNILVIEYDGFVFSKGIAVIAAINSFTVGLAVGFDNLLDKNKKYWIYESKPWLGLTVGVNIN